MRSLNGILVFAIVFPAFGQPAALEPWKWTAEQRLAVRFDPQSRAERIAESVAAEGRRTAVAGVSSTAHGDVLSGNSHPELFLPTELFESLIEEIHWNGNFRSAFRAESDDVLRTDAEWSAFDELVKPYAENLSEERRLLDELGVARRTRRDEIDRRLTQLRTVRCSLEKAAIRNVRRHFGAERFERFLYTVVVSGRQIGYGPGTPEMYEATRARLLANERNCQ